MVPFYHFAEIESPDFFPFLSLRRRQHQPRQIEIIALSVLFSSLPTFMLIIGTTSALQTATRIASRARWTFGPDPISKTKN
jgi:hypothetical protein